MSDSYSGYEDRIDAAIDALYHDQYINCIIAARVFNVAPQTLQRQ